MAKSSKKRRKPMNVPEPAPMGRGNTNPMIFDGNLIVDGDMGKKIHAECAGECSSCAHGCDVIKNEVSPEQSQPMQVMEQPQSPYDNGSMEHMEYKKGVLYFHLPDYSGHFRLNYLLATLLLDSPQLFYPNIAIGSVYGSFPSAIWNGGRVVLGPLVGREEIKNCYRAFNNIGIPLRHTFTNGLIDDKLCYDQYCNQIMLLGDNKFNQVLVKSEELETYIRRTYPDYDVLSSTTKRILSVSDLEKEASKDYKLTVIDYALNRDPDIFFLKDKSKYEILVNAYCIDNCPRRAQHYHEMANDQLHFGHVETEGYEQPIGGCKYIGDDFFVAQANRKDTIHPEEVYGYYAEEGFQHFKIEGRTTNPFDVLESYVQYMVLPEYRDHVRLMILRRLFEDPQQAAQPQIMIMSEKQIKELEEAGQIQRIAGPPLNES